MSAVDAFFDTSVLLYLLSSDAAKSDRVETLLAAWGRDLRKGAAGVGQD